MKFFQLALIASFLFTPQFRKEAEPFKIHPPHRSAPDSHGLCSYSYESPLIAGFSFEQSFGDSRLPALRKALGPTLARLPLARSVAVRSDDGTLTKNTKTLRLVRPSLLADAQKLEERRRSSSYDVSAIFGWSRRR